MVLPSTIFLIQYIMQNIKYLAGYDKIIMIYPEKYQKNSKIITRKRNYIMIVMFTFLFEGATSSRETLYYNNLQDKISNASYSYLY